jgi:diguanylate cyclase (GGDEF)-like protein/PAS domain S-box-containing protein
MNILDVRTVMISYIISNGITAVVILLLWHQNHRRFSGIGFWLADYIMQFVAVLMIVTRNAIPEIIPVILGNGLVMAGTLLLFVGLERFVGKRGPQLHNVVLLAAFLGAQTYFFLVTPSLTARNINISTTLLILCLQAAWLLLYRTPREFRPFSRGVGVVFAGYCVVSLFRIIADLFVSSGTDFFKSNFYDTLVLMMYQMLFIALTFYLVLMVNRRLFSDLERDIQIRRQVEEALRVSEEKFSKAFHADPDAVLITRAHDGRLQEVNDGFSNLSEYTREEALSSTTVSLAIWANPRDRDSCVTALRKEGSIHNVEYDFRTKSGKILHCLYSGEIINLAGEAHILSIVRDVTSQKQAEEILRLRLSLWEYAAAHSVEELMQKALDEIELITDSPISFYHFVMEDQLSLSLQAWSTRTRREFCLAEAQGMHYDLDRAGVWADCIRERKPVVHNDYASLPRRKGMPQGHARVVRELVVPTFHGGRIVAVLGIGNKSSPYKERDTALLSSIADIIWSIIDHKRTEEEIQRLQAQLREMAIHDSLTGLYNRHYLNETLKRELARAAREKYSISFIMIDIDHFKRVNDTYGHKAGDSVLQDLAVQLLNNSRASDILYRYGGEEFLAILPKVKADYAYQIAEKWRKGFLDSPILREFSGAKTTISCGIAAYPKHATSAANLIVYADQALYQAKAAGRNRSVLWKKANAPRQSPRISKKVK